MAQARRQPSNSRAGAAKAAKAVSRKVTPAKPTPARRTSGRLSGSASKPVTGKKSIYFDGGGSDQSDDEDVKEDSASEEYDADDADTSLPTSAATSDHDASEDSSDELASGSRKRKRAPHKSPAAARKATKSEATEPTDLWRPGVKSHLAPGQEVVVKLPKARSAGSTPYRDDTIHPNTLLFLGDLKRHNEREWLKAYDADFRQAQRDFAAFVECVTAKLVEQDETIPELPSKDIVFRIYRDVRFSNDPTPYKTHFSAAWSRTGRKGPYAAYYLQVAPGSCFLGGGLWCPEAAPLSLLRVDVDTQSQNLKAVLTEKKLAEKFLGGPKNEKHAIKAFTGQNASNALKRHPKGYDESNANIELLRLRNFTIGRKLKDDEILGPGGLERVIDLFGALVPFVSHLNSVVMPDPAAQDDDSESSDDE